MACKVDVETVDALRRRLAIEVPADVVHTELERAYADLSRAAKVPGFRPGRAPRAVLERLFGDRVRAEVFGKLIQDSYAEAIESRHIEPVSRPEIVTDQTEAGAALRYHATVEVKPELVIENYAGVEAERVVEPVLDADVDNYIETLRQSLATLSPIADRTRAERSDVATIDYEARAEGRVVSRGENRTVELGANRFPPEFDAHLVGADVGTRIEFATTYPVDAAAGELAGRTVTFAVQLRSLSHKEVPALDDEFAKDHGECSTLEELRQRVRRQLEEEAGRRADETVRRELVSQLAKRYDIPVPPAMVQRRTDALIEDVLHEWQQQRIRPKDETQAVERLRKELEPRATEQVQIALMLEAIARQEQLSVEEREVDERISALATAAGGAAERVRALYQEPEARQQLRLRMLQARAVDAVVNRAAIRTVMRATNVAEVSENG